MAKELDERFKRLEGTSPLELILKDVKLTGGQSFRRVEINNDKGLTLFQKYAADYPVPEFKPFPPRRVFKPIGEAHAPCLILVDACDKSLISIQRKNTAETIVQKNQGIERPRSLCGESA